MEVTLVDSVLMTSDQGLLVIHLLSLQRVSMATAAELSDPSWTHADVPFECWYGRMMDKHGFLGFTKLHQVVRMTARQEI